MRGEQPVSEHKTSPCGLLGAPQDARGTRGELRFPMYPGSRTRCFAFGVLLLVGACLVLAGCGDQIRRPTPEELARFQAADPPRSSRTSEGPPAAAGPMVDMNRVLQAKIVTGPYRAVPGDVLRLEMLRFLEQRPTDTATTADNRQIYNCRIGDNGDDHTADRGAARGGGQVAGGNRSGHCRPILSEVRGGAAAGVCERGGIPDAAGLHRGGRDPAGDPFPAARSDVAGVAPDAGGRHHHAGRGRDPHHPGQWAGRGPTRWTER